MRLDSQDLTGALEARPTLSSGHDADLKIEVGEDGRRIGVWLSRDPAGPIGTVDVEVQDPRTGNWVPSWHPEIDFADALELAHFADWQRGDW
jgi:hypothetical protein